MHHEEIELNFDASSQQILGLESEILWEAYSASRFEANTAVKKCLCGLLKNYTEMFSAKAETY
jgi:hypothetical protein